MLAAGRQGGDCQNIHQQATLAMKSPFSTSPEHVCPTITELRCHCKLLGTVGADACGHTHLEPWYLPCMAIGIHT